MSTYYIYGLVDPENKQIYYVGMSRNPRARLQQHLCCARVQSSRMAPSEWISILLQRGLAPEMIILEEYEALCNSEAIDVENQWIIYYQFNRAPLLNRRWRMPMRRRSRVLPGREPSLHFESSRGWYYEDDN